MEKLLTRNFNKSTIFLLIAYSLIAIASAITHNSSFIFWGEPDVPEELLK